MSVRIKRYSANGNEQPEWVEGVSHEVTVDNMSHHFGMNEVKNFADDGIGLAIAAGAATNSGIVQDTIPFGTSRA